jgi:hypothetical protein
MWFYVQEPTLEKPTCAYQLINLHVHATMPTCAYPLCWPEIDQGGEECSKVTLPHSSPTPTNPSSAVK